MIHGYKPAHHLKKKKYSMEKTFCHHSSSQHLGTSLGMHKGFILCRQPGYCGYMENREYQVCRYYCPNLHAIFYAARFIINLIITHIGGINNAIADALSYFQVTHFQQLVPHTAPLSIIIPAWPSKFLKESSATVNH